MISSKTREQARALYYQNQELIDSDALNGPGMHQAIARTVKALAGVA